MPVDWFQGGANIHPMRCPHCSVELPWVYNISTTVQYICQECYEIRKYNAKSLKKDDHDRP